MIELENLLRAMTRHGAETAGPVFVRQFVAFSNDSRTISPGELFVALRTEKGDGHEFINDAVARGASGILCEYLPEDLVDLAAPVATIVKVSDTRAALLDWATHALDAYHPYRMAIIGGVGKSSARAALLRALGGDGGSSDIFSNGNRNDELGIPLALGELRPDQSLAVLEVAGGSAAELERLGQLLRPDMAVITSSASPVAEDPASTSFRKGLAGFIASLAPGGVLVVNGDDADLAALLEKGGAGGERRVVRYGLREGVDVAGAIVEQTAHGSVLSVCYRGLTNQIRISAVGLGAIYAAVAAVAAAVGLGRGLKETAALLDGLAPQPGRLSPLAGLGGLEILDDTFSANAASLAHALETLDLFPRPHTAVLGEISGVRQVADLPSDSVSRLSELDRLVLQGRDMALLGRELRAHASDPERIVMTYSARDSADAVLGFGVAPSYQYGGKGATVLVKGSDTARMERVVELLLPEPERAREGLVRQDEGWRRRTYVPNERPTWVEVDLDAIRSNLAVLKAAAAPAEVMAVLKADAYGHGARWVARTAALNGVAMLGVASLNEALDLRAEGITTPILILGYAPPWQARDLALSGIRATLFSLPVAEHFSRVAHDLGREIVVHIKVDTGMTRLGVLPEDVSAFVETVAALPGIRVEGIFSHMATSDTDVDFAMEQGGRFQALLKQLDAAGNHFRYIHMENSAAVMRQLPFAANLVRVGMALYGLYPLSRDETDVELRPALSFKTRVAQVKSVPAGTSVSYGRHFITDRPSRIAILPVGYGDGFRRSPANWGHVLVRGRRAPVVGVVAMDMTMIDVTDIRDVREGDEVVLIGRQGSESITAEDVAAALGTNSYEVVTQILPRVPRQTR